MKGLSRADYGSAKEREGIDATGYDLSKLQAYILIFRYFIFFGILFKGHGLLTPAS